MSARCSLTMVWGTLVASACSGPKPFTIGPPLLQGLAACGGGIALATDAEPSPGELDATGTVTALDRGEHALRVTLDGGQQFALSLDPGTPAPLAVADRIEVSIRCQPVARDVVDCHGAVLRAGDPVAFDREMTGWTIERGPLLSRVTHPNYGPTETYGLVFTHDQVSVTSPLRGCGELRTAGGTYRVSGAEVVHRDPRPADASDYRSIAVVRTQ